MDASVRQAMAKMVNIRIVCSWFLGVFIAGLSGGMPPSAEPVL
jgi:hypothetical protein